MTVGLQGFIEGKVVRYSALPTADLAIRKIAAAEALSRYVDLDDKTISSIPIDPNLWPNFGGHQLDRHPNTGKGLEYRDRRLADARQILRSRINLQRGRRWDFRRRRSVLLLLYGITGRKHSKGDPHSAAGRRLAFRYPAGALTRMRRGHWDTTVANAWGALAVEKFSDNFESVPVTGTITAGINRNTAAVNWSRCPAGKACQFNWPRWKRDAPYNSEREGAPWATIRSMAAIPLKEPFSSGYKIRKTITAVEQKVKGKWSRGDILRVNLDMKAQSDMTWVVVNDPIPAGAASCGPIWTSSLSLLQKKRAAAGRGWPSRSAPSRRSAVTMNTSRRASGRWISTIRLNNEGLLPNACHTRGSPRRPWRCSGTSPTRM